MTNNRHTKPAPRDANAPSQTNQFMTKQEVAALLGVGVRTVERFSRNGKIPTLAITSRIVRFDREALIQYMRNNFTVGAKAEVKA